MPEGCFVPEVYIVWIIRFVFVLMGMVVFIGIVYSRFEGHLRIACILDILGTEDIYDLGHLGYGGYL